MKDLKKISPQKTSKVPKWAIIAVFACLVLAAMLGSRTAVLSVDSGVAQVVSQTDSTLTLTLDNTASSSKYRGNDYTIEDGNLILTVYISLFGGAKWPVTVEITDDAISSVQHIYLTDGTNVKLIG